MKQVSRVGAVVGLGMLTAGAAQGQTPPLPKVYAIVGAKIEVGDGRVIAKGTVVVREGIIEAVGENVKAPADAEIIEGAGLTVYPGFVDAFASTALKLPDAQPIQDTPPDPVASASPSMREANRKGVRPELRAVDHFQPADASLLTARKSGFTVHLLASSGGLMSGEAGLVTLSGKPRRESVLKPVAAEVFGFSLGRGGFGGGYPATTLGHFSHLRQTLLDARRFALQNTAYAHSSGSARPPYDETLSVLQPVLSGSLPVIFEADNQNEIYQALRFAKEFGIRPMIVGGSEAYKEPELLLKSRVSIILSLGFGKEPGAKPTSAAPLPPKGKLTPPPRGAKPPKASPPNPTVSPFPPKNTQTPRPPQGQIKEDRANTEPKDQENGEETDLPKAVLEDRKRKWSEKVAGASVLSKAGIPFAFTTKGTKTPTEFFENLRRAVKAGLPRDAALKALTSQPAVMFGLLGQMGTVAPGKIALLTVLTGDFLDEKVKVKYLFVDREKLEPDKEKPASAAPTRPGRFPGSEEFDPH